MQETFNLTQVQEGHTLKPEQLKTVGPAVLCLACGNIYLFTILFVVVLLWL